MLKQVLRLLKRLLPEKQEKTAYDLQAGEVAYITPWAGNFDKTGLLVISRHTEVFSALPETTHNGTVFIKIKKEGDVVFIKSEGAYALLASQAPKEKINPRHGYMVVGGGFL